MHPLFRVDDPLPVAPGESPFHIRGLYYDRVLAGVRKDTGGVARLLDAIEDDRVRRFIQQKFSWNGWYDVFPVVPVYAAIARMRGQDFETAVYEGTRRGALEAIPSLFRLAMRVTGVAALAGRAAHVVIYSTNFTRIDIQKFTEAGSAATGSGIPLFAAPHIANLCRGYFQAALELRGCTDVWARYTSVSEDGEKGGFKTVTIGYEFGWSRFGL